METEMKKHELYDDGRRNVRFLGAQIAEVSTWRPSNNTRWTEIDIYQTRGGAYVVQVTGRTLWQGEAQRYTVYTCRDEDSVVEVLHQDGYLSRLAKKALDEAGINYAIDVA